MLRIRRLNWIVGTCCTVLALSAMACVAGAVAGYSQTLPWLAVTAGLLVSVGAVRIISKRFVQHRFSCSDQSTGTTSPAQLDKRSDTESSKPEIPGSQLDDPEELVQRMIDEGREALLLRPQIASNMEENQLLRASARLDETMGIVPEGNVLLESWRDQRESQQAGTVQDRIVHVDALYLDRYPVTNQQYQLFVDDGGYERISLWHSKIWPAVLEFVDQTGYSGPRFWKHGRFPDGKGDHPVVGVSWYEAAAYARWIGKRLPTDPEWIKAGSWPIVTSGTRPTQRRYPWGDSMDANRANIWGTGPDNTTPVGEMSGGVSVGGVYDLIGNVWEWTTSEFGAWDTSERHLDTSVSLKSLRGGAYDTYFQTQATCQFQSGESPVNRKHNIGFRCALAMCDVALMDPEVENLETEGALASYTSDAMEGQIE